MQREGGEGGGVPMKNKGARGWGVGVWSAGGVVKSVKDLCALVFCGSDFIIRLVSINALTVCDFDNTQRPYAKKRGGCNVVVCVF